MIEGTEQLILTIDAGAESDARELADMTAHLRRRLLELDVQDVELVRTTDIPEGAKPADSVTLGALSVTLSPAVIGAVVALVKAWFEHRPVRTAKATIGDDSLELTNVDPAEQERLVQAFIARHETK